MASHIQFERGDEGKRKDLLATTIFTPYAS